MLNMRDMDLGYSTRRNLYSKAVNVLFNQMTAAKGIKLFGETAVATIFKEYKILT